MSEMMKSPWTCVVLMTLLIVVTLLVHGAVRLRAAKEKRGGGTRFTTTISGGRAREDPGVSR